MLIESLFRRFIPGSGDITNPRVRERYGMAASLLGIISNIGLVILKILAGLMMGSLAIVADGLNNLSDSVSSIVSLVSFRIAGKPPDKDHPFGHGRAEHISALVVAGLILLVGYEILKQSISLIIQPQPLSFNPVLALLLLLSMGVKLWQMRVNQRIGRLIRSKTLQATGTDSRNDVLVTGGTLAGILIFRFTGLNLDPYISALIGLFILYSGFSISREVVSILLGESLDREEAERIRKSILAYPGILGVHDLISHAYGLAYNMVTIHVEVDDRAGFRESHDLIDRIEKEVGAELGILLVIHVDPVADGDPRMEEVRDRISSILQGVDPRISPHDIRLIPGKEGAKVLFDLELPYHFPEEEKEPLVRRLEEGLRELDPDYEAVVDLEYSYVSD